MALDAFYGLRLEGSGFLEFPSPTAPLFFFDGSEAHSAEVRLAAKRLPLFQGGFSKSYPQGWVCVKSS